jgi:hypothetical protein
MCLDPMAASRLSVESYVSPGCDTSIKKDSHEKALAVLIFLIEPAAGRIKM